MYDTILFDFFGVIFNDPQKLFLQRYPHAQDAVTGVARLLDTGRITYSQYIRCLAALGGKRPSAVQKGFVSPSLLNKPVVETITNLSKTWRVGLLSNTCTEEINLLFEKHDLRQLFRAVVISSETGLAKPDLGIFRLALRRLGSQAEHTVFVDDSETNVLAARQAGLTAIHFKDIGQLHAELERLGIVANVARKEI